MNVSFDNPTIAYNNEARNIYCLLVYLIQQSVSMDFAALDIEKKTLANGMSGMEAIGI